MDPMARIWEEHDSVLSIPACQEGRTLQPLQQQPRAQHVHVERTRNRAIQYGQQWMGASRLERAEPHGSPPGQENYFMAHWTLCWGPTWDSERGHIRGGSTPGSRWAAESEWGPRNRSVLSPTAVHRDRGLHCTCYLNRGPTWTPSRPPARQNHSGFGVAVLNCMRKLKNRPFWTAVSGLQCAACHVLAALSGLQQRPHVPLFEIVL
jgi:hypothetical protein